MWQKNELVFRIYTVKFNLPLIQPYVLFLRDNDDLWELKIQLTNENDVPHGIISAVTSEVLASKYNTFIYNATRQSAHYEDPLGRYNFKEQHQLSTTVSQNSSTPNATGNAIMNNLIKSSKIMAFAMHLDNGDDIEFKIFHLSRYIWVASVTEVTLPYEWVFETADKNQMIVVRTSNSEILWAAFIDKTVT